MFALVYVLNLTLLIWDATVVKKDPYLLPDFFFKHRDFFELRGYPPVILICMTVINFRYRWLINLFCCSNEVKGIYTFLFGQYYLQYWMNGNRD